MFKHNRLLSILTLALLMMSTVLMTSSVGAFPVSTADTPGLLPNDCQEVTEPGEDPPACCAYGYVYYGGVPVSDAQVTVQGPGGSFSTTTSTGPSSTYPYYRVSLSASPPNVSPGDTMTVTATYAGTSGQAIYEAIANGQQVDVVLASTVPDVINYQGRLTDAAGTPLTGEYNITFRIHDAASGGNPLWAEAWNGATQRVSVTDGVFSVLLGSFNPLPPTISQGTERWLGVEVNSDGEMVPRHRLGKGFWTDQTDELDGHGSDEFVLADCTPSQIALKRCWYEANQAGIKFNMGSGSGPKGLTFDGHHLWVSNFDADTITKLRVSDGAIIGAYAAGNAPYRSAFDGANIWVINAQDNQVSKIRASDGALLNSYSTGNRPQEILFDGTNIWVANRDDDTVTKLRASDGALLDTCSVGDGPRGLAFDGTNIWVANGGNDTVSKLRASDCQPINLSIPAGTAPGPLAFDGSSIWVVNLGSTSVTRLRASDGTDMGTYTVGTSPYDLVFDGAHIWVANFDVSGTVTKLRASDGKNLGTFTADNGPQAIAFDGVNIWVANHNAGTVSKL